MSNYRLLIQYDGTNYCGWQSQQNASSVQQTIISAIELITKKKVNLIGSGRTDSGVHAIGQVANFRIEDDLNLYEFRYSLDSILPKDISIKKIEQVEESFHARYDARERSYLYLIVPGKSPFYDKYAYRYSRIVNTDFDNLNKISKALLGENDFTSFCRKNSETEDKVCKVADIHWRKGKELSFFYIKANRYLHGMVRTIVGTILHASENNYGEEFIREVLTAKERESAKEAVPAKGLFLFKVKY